MEHLFQSERAFALMQKICASRLLIAFDFDGTLAPIVDDPNAVALAPEMRHAVLDLQRLAPIAIITGRALRDITPRLGFRPDALVGNHGMEGLPQSIDALQSTQTLCAQWAEKLRQALADEAINGEVQFEDKGLSLSLHYRHARDPAWVEKRLLELVESILPTARLVGGKCVINVLPSNAADKGRALKQLMRHFGAANAVYVGDDVTDEDVFCMHDASVLTVRVGQSSNSAAHYFVDSVAEVGELIAKLTQALVANGDVNWITSQADEELIRE